MKKLLVTMVLVGMLLSGCDNAKKINGRVYQTYGVVNKDDIKDPNVRYKISTGSVIVAIIFSETVLIPLYVLGWDLYEPVDAL